jgi:hypothetical protein
MSQTFKVGGVTKNARGQVRVKVSTLSIQDTINRQVAANDTDILYVDLPKAMTREEVPAYLITLDQFKNNVAYAEAINKKLGRNKPAIAVKMPTKPAKVEVDSKIQELALA